MNGTDTMWTQLFQEKPINEASLGNLKTGVMTQVLASPIDFQAKILVAQRRKWGVFLLVVLLAAGLGSFGLIWFEGEWLLSLISHAPEWFRQQGRLLSQLILGLEYLWQQYVWPFVGIAFAWVLFDGIRHKMQVKE